MPSSDVAQGGLQDNETGRQWLVYIVRCADDSLYTGITNNLDRRLDQHNGIIRNGARYTSGRRPVQLEWQEPMIDRASALQREAEIKRLTRKQKERLIATSLC